MIVRFKVMVLDCGDRMRELCQELFRDKLFYWGVETLGSSNIFVRYDVITIMNVTIIVFWYVTSRSPVEICGCFGGTC
jgi:hypothetical protein